MKVAILCGGLGTRLAEETQVKPKPMVEVGGRPILWHIMNIYASQGFNDFVVALGYKGEVIKEYFLDYHRLQNNFRIHLGTGEITVEDGKRTDWSVELIDTGAASMTGGRVKRLAPYVRDGTFMLTYGDGVADIDLHKLLAFHRSHGKLCTVTSVRPPARFGGIAFEGDRIANFVEKPQIGEGWINGGFFVMEPGVLDYIEGDESILERTPMERLASDGQLMGYRHDSFWQCMDTVRDLKLLQSLWDSGEAPWKVRP